MIHTRAFACVCVCVYGREMVYVCVYLLFVYAISDALEANSAEAAHTTRVIIINTVLDVVRDPDSSVL